MIVSRARVEAQADITEAFMILRAACDSDLEAILAVYNHAVATTTATFDTVPRSLPDQREWFAAHVAPYAVIVCEERGQVVGWASISAFSPRPAYRFTGEASVTCMMMRAGGDGAGAPAGCDGPGCRGGDSTPWWAVSATR